MCSWLHRFSLSVFMIMVCAAFSVGADLQSAKQAYEQQNYTVAIKQFTVLAEQGSTEAQLFLGKMYMLGQGVPSDRELAIKWFKPVAAQGNADAQFFLGAMYLLPQKDITEGLKWLQLSAEQGMQDAQYLLGKAYMQGAGQLPRDPVQGAMWLQLAANNNKKFYQDEFEGAQKQLTAEQAAQAKALAAAWKPKTTPESKQHPK